MNLGLSEELKIVFIIYRHIYNENLPRWLKIKGGARPCRGPQRGPPLFQM
jgi:hypothetical protein